MCSSSQQPAAPSLVSPPQAETSLPPPTVTRGGADVPGEPEVDDFSPTPLANSTVLPPASDSVEKLDAFVPQTTDSVPEDIGPENDDVLDFYGEEPDSPIEKSAPTQDVPLDLEEEDSSQPDSAAQMSRSLSQPTARAPKAEPAAAPRSHSVYLPGHYSDPEDEGYQGGTVTIVRSNR